MVGMATATCNSILDAICNATSYSVATPYLKLHVGDPGAAGTSNPAAETLRKLVSFGAAASAAIANDTAISWTGLTNVEDFTHWTLWDAVTGGNFIGSGTITANAVASGDTFTIPIGDIDITLTAAA